MLQSLRAISSSSQRIAVINQTIWNQLDNNEWLYIAPQPDTLIILCSKQDPTDIEIEGTGKVKLQSNCKAHGARVLIQAQAVVSYNNTERHYSSPILGLRLL
jgi:hypothetical protein